MSAVVKLLGLAALLVACGSLPAGTMPVTEDAKLTAGDADDVDWFGFSVALSGGTALVGASQDDHAGGGDAGSAYVFVDNGTRWEQQAKLTAFDAADLDRFGNSVALSGNTALVAARADDHAGGDGAGSVYVFVRTEPHWKLEAKLTASDAAPADEFGTSVALSGDTAVVGAREDDHAGGMNAGSAYVFVRDGSSWSEQARLTASDAAVGDRFGISVAISGETAVVGARGDDNAGGEDAGSVYVFVRSGSDWSEQAKLTASDAHNADQFGISVSIDGESAVVGADHVDIGSGAAYVFVRSGSSWSEEAKLVGGDTAPGDGLGSSVAVMGDTALVGARDDDHSTFDRTGSAYVFVRGESGWTERAKLTASDAADFDRFGFSAAISGDTALVGAYLEGRENLLDAGSAYVFMGLPIDDVDDVPASGVGSVVAALLVLLTVSGAVLLRLRSEA